MEPDPNAPTDPTDPPTVAELRAERERARNAAWDAYNAATAPIEAIGQEVRAVVLTWESDAIERAWSWYLATDYGEPDAHAAARTAAYDHAQALKDRANAWYVAAHAGPQATRDAALSAADTALIAGLESLDPGTWGRCADCDGAFDADDLTERADRCVCESCADDYSTCEHCDTTVPNGDTTTVGVRNPRNDRYYDQTWCDGCASSHADRCACCGATVDDTINTDDGGVCWGCYDDSYFTCEACDRARHTDSYGNDGRCEDCDGGGAIMDYSTDPLDYLSFLGTGPVFYGIELEIEARNTSPGDGATTAIASLGSDFAICKHDGSLSNGFEVVTAPADLATHRERWARYLLPRVPRGVRSWDTETCGMHVHVSREPLSQLTIGKILVFLNADENAAGVTGIAGRGPNRWADRSPKKITDATASYARSDRYVALNLSNEHTIEFRIFKGTLRYESVIRNVEFCAALVTWCATDAGIANLDWTSFAAWVGRDPKAYPALTAWLRGRGYLKAIRPKPGTTTTETPDA